MLKLYKVTFFFRQTVRSFQPIMVSERNKVAAVSRARAFVKTNYSERIVLETVEMICRTPDDVLDWA